MQKLVKDTLKMTREQLNEQPPIELQNKLKEIYSSVLTNSKKLDTDLNGVVMSNLDNLYEE